MAADPPFVVRSRAVYLPDADTVIVADLHLGRDHSSNVEFPLGERTSVEERVRALVEMFEPTEVVVAGDVLHSFSQLPHVVEDSLAVIREVIRSQGGSLVLVHGNHDTMLEPIDDFVEEYRLADDTLVCHGHEEPDSSADRYVIGHEHPAIEIEGKRQPCFLWGIDVYDGGDVLVLPAFSELAPGTRVNKISGSDVQSPLLAGLESFRPIVYDGTNEEALTFPPLGDLQAHL